MMFSCSAWFVFPDAERHLGVEDLLDYFRVGASPGRVAEKTSLSHADSAGMTPDGAR
jgi:hypothetical protein